MEALSNAKIENILSLTGNNKCFECEDPNVDWVSFPATVFICLNCGRRHKEFKPKPTLKSLSVSEFSQHEIKKMNLGGNARYHTLMDEYKISLKEPNIEYKYNTVISLYYFKLLETQVNKIENNIGADEEYNKILGERPTYEIGRQLSQGYVINEGNALKEIGENKEENNDKYKADSTLGGWLGYFGDQINNMTEYIGLNNVLSTAQNNINNTLQNSNIKNAFNKAVDFTKSTGEYMINKANEISQSNIIQETKEKISQTLGGLKDSAINMINNNINNINNINNNINNINNNISNIINNNINNNNINNNIINNIENNNQY